MTCAHKGYTEDPLGRDIVAAHFFGETLALVRRPVVSARTRTTGGVDLLYGRVHASHRARAASSPA